MTISDTRGADDDISGDLLASRAEAAGHRLAARAWVADEIDAIRGQTQAWLDADPVDVIISTGGTGLTGRDVTVEALTPLFDKHIDGFSALFHQLSYDKIGSSTIQSRACAGVAAGRYIFALPGSPGACRDAWDGILQAQLDNRHRPCNLVEIMPRITER